MTKEVFFMRFHRYVYGHGSTRLKDDRWSLVIALSYSLLMIVLDEPEQSVALQGLVVLGLSMLSFMMYNIVGGVTTARDDRRTGLTYLAITRRNSWAYATLGALC